MTIGVLARRAKRRSACSAGHSIWFPLAGTCHLDQAGPPIGTLTCRTRRGIDERASREWQTALTATRCFRRRWHESRGDEFASWALPPTYFEVGDDGWLTRQIEVYDAGPTFRNGLGHEKGATVSCAGSRRWRSRTSAGFHSAVTGRCRRCQP
jgi:hypothetical protein